MQHPSAEPADDAEDKDEIDEDGEEDDSIDEDIVEDNGDRKRPPSSCLIARTITLQMLLADRLLEPGEGAMTIEYMGQRFVGDLLPDGKIRSQETDIVFVTPSAWAVNCRRIINPGKKSGCGWASIKYKGRKLDAFKNIWINRRNEEREKLCVGVDDYGSSIDKDNTMLAPPPPPPPSAPVTSAGPVTVATTAAAMVTATTTAAAIALATATATSTAVAAPVVVPPKPLIRMPVKHHNIGNRTSMHDPNMLVESTAFSALGKIQPFLVSISSNALLVMDFHCHLTTSEVCGYLAGQWDVNAHNLAVTYVFPCRSRLDDQANGPTVEKEIRKEIEQRGLLPVGWYHSHPMLPASPSLRDIDKQLDHEMHMKGSSDSSYTPCVGFICSPYFTDTSNMESSIVSFWVAPPPENKPLEYGKPMLMNYSIVQDNNLHPDVLKEMTALIEFYKDMHDFIDFNKVYKSELTYLEKLKATLSPKFPRDQTDGVLWGFIRQLVTPGSEEKDDDGNVKVYTPETTTVITTNTSTSTTSTCPTTLVVPLVVPGSRNSGCTSVTNSINSNSLGTANSTTSALSSTNTTSAGFFLGSDMTSAIIAAGKLPAGTSLMSVLPGNNQNMFISPLGLNLLNNSNANKGCKNSNTTGSNLATISGLGNLGNLGNLSLANLANLNNLALGNMGNLASISLSNKNLSGTNINTNNFRNNANVSVSISNASTHCSHVSTSSSVSHPLLSTSVTSVSSTVPTSSVIGGFKTSVGSIEITATNDVPKKSENDTPTTVPVSKEDIPAINSTNSLSSAAVTNNILSLSHSSASNSSVNNISNDVNGSKVINSISVSVDKSIGNQLDSDPERPAKIPKLDGTSVVTR
ncbi:MPN domain-containing protein [Frankliniella fusca]|uniref:MPN domain-containing protein n=1 Tax=Frankliniella fusca TaxID=407009 RepID=A0AAE1I3C7_9NEOP|nr:MPN domain-containing protein [Frankliniella fusca]